MKKAKYCAEFYTEFGTFEHSVLSDNLYYVLQACLEGKSNRFRHILYMLDGSEYIRIPDFEYDELTPETFRLYRRAWNRLSWRIGHFQEAAARGKAPA